MSNFFIATEGIFFFSRNFEFLFVSLSLAVCFGVLPPVIVVTLVDMSKKDLTSIITISKKVNGGLEIDPKASCSNLTYTYPELSA